MSTVAQLENGKSLLGDQRFNALDFQNRWQRARCSAILSVLVAANLPENNNDETNLLLLVRTEQKEAVLKAVFDFSRKFGVGLSKFFSLSLEVRDLEEILPFSGSPCVGGIWQAHNGSSVSRKLSCFLPEKFGSFACDYWREALDGFVMGVSDDVRLARHRSLGHGDSECMDILFSDTGGGPQNGFHRGRIPEELEKNLGGIALRFLEKGISVVWEGFSEGVLFYRMEAGAVPLCGAGGQLMHGALKAEFQKFYPDIKLRDSSPLAVMGEEAK